MLPDLGTWLGLECPPPRAQCAGMFWVPALCQDSGSVHLISGARGTFQQSMPVSRRPSKMAHSLPLPHGPPGKCRCFLPSAELCECPVSLLEGFLPLTDPCR